MKRSSLVNKRGSSSSGIKRERVSNLLGTVTIEMTMEQGETSYVAPLRDVEDYWLSLVWQLGKL